ncbi:MAG: formyltetrahydrofolate deformylase [Aphanocapsa sp. GSE-SYN-MK-11-07L]|nr:formyltetrahydrofolate deformylase [Aphanocapsa sp. GSE-SYN-MK-11-07L]
MSSTRHYTLTLSCPDRVGVVAAVSSFIASHNGWITEAQHHADWEQKRFFMRQEVLAESLPFETGEFCQRFQAIAEPFQMDWRLTDSAQKKRVVILVSKFGHCLYELLASWQSGDLEVEIAGVISNHEVFQKFVEWHEIPFYYVPVTLETKSAAYEKVMYLYEALKGDVMVLARYMQVLSAQICDRYPGQIINIHHSFLPSFVGAKPYHQAYARGVKLIGATCHYVTSELDAGPIIDQDVIRIDHTDAVDDLIRYGKDIEKTVLTRGLRYHIQDRVLLHGNKTVVFK